MTLNEALSQLTVGGPGARRPGGAEIRRSNTPQEGSGHVYCRADGGPFDASSEDLAATDWEIADAKALRAQYGENPPRGISQSSSQAPKKA